MDSHAHNKLSRIAGETPDPALKFCGKCKPPLKCCCLATVAAPLDCIPCARSQTRKDIYAEIPVSGDWDGRNFVMRIGCTCEKCMADDLEKDETRIIDFELLDEAIKQWNQLQSEIAEFGEPQ